MSPPAAPAPAAAERGRDASSGAPLRIGLHAGVWLRHDAISNSLGRKLRIIDALRARGRPVEATVFVASSDVADPRVRASRDVVELLGRPELAGTHVHVLEFGIYYPGFDVVYARGLSHYHYDLMSRKAIHTTAGLMRYLRADGVLIMAIVTDLSGRREPDKVWQNTLEDYERHFSFFGKRWSVGWHKGMAICGVYKDPMELPTVVSESQETPEELEPALSV